jgi:hypothetical protein
MAPGEACIPSAMAGFGREDKKEKTRDESESAEQLEI